MRATSVSTLKMVVEVMNPLSVSPRKLSAMKNAIIGPNSIDQLIIIFLYIISAYHIPYNIIWENNSVTGYTNRTNIMAGDRCQKLRFYPALLPEYYLFFFVKKKYEYRKIPILTKKEIC